jgi:hypothetical protein
VLWKDVSTPKVVYKSRRRLHFLTAQKFGPSWQERPAIVAVDRPEPDEKACAEDETARLCVVWGAQGVGAFFRSAMAG